MPPAGFASTREQSQRSRTQLRGNLIGLQWMRLITSEAAA